MDVASRALAVVVAVAALACVAAPADGARFKVTFSGRDTLHWNVATAPGAAAICGRGGSGVQDVRFTDAHPLTVEIGKASSGGVGFGRRHEVELALPGSATMLRTDETTLPAGCESSTAKDCGTEPLPAFFPVLGSLRANRLQLTGEYWHSEPEPPFKNCLALQTPEGLDGGGAPYDGWNFGTGLPEDEHVPVATPPVVLSALSRGRSYRFAAHKSFSLNDHQLHGSIIFLNGVPTSATLGGPSSISDSFSWQVTLERVG